MAAEELPDIWWDRVAALRMQADQSCEGCGEWPNERQKFFTRVTTVRVNQPKSDPTNLGIFCYKCRPQECFRVGRRPRASSQLSLFK